MNYRQSVASRITALLCSLALAATLVPGVAFAETEETARPSEADVGQTPETATEETALTTAPVRPLSRVATYAAVQPLADGQGKSFDDYTVEGVTPVGTTIDLFDYDTTEINKINGNDDRPFRFGGNLPGPSLPDGSTLVPGYINTWTGKYMPPRTGIVANTLSNGYPELSDKLQGNVADRSLAYLFNQEEVNGKTIYADVGGLLQVDDDGYFYYDCTKNFASLNTENNEFALYNGGAVENQGTTPGWQFFPFNTAGDVFVTNENGEPVLGDKGNLQPKNIKSNNSILDHQFGVHMSTQFVQQHGGYTTEDHDTRKVVTYNFSGDDDVWVFIDGVLVGDLGGIHDAAALQIDFSTGDIVVYADGYVGDGDSTDHDDTNYRKDLLNNAYDKGEIVYESSTLRDKFEDAEASLDDFDGNNKTFADGTTHTLDFFYLERGGFDSNMRLKYNLLNIPASGIVKQDQNGTPLADVNFKLYKANENYIYDDDDLYYEGITDKNGVLTLTETKPADPAHTVPITMESLRRQSPYWVLVEEEDEETHSTYRLPGPIHLYFYGETDLLLSANAWETGTYAQPCVTVQADAIPNSATTMFAVVMKNVDGEWRPVSGDPWEGWHLADSANDESIWAAAQANDTFFTVDSSGAYTLKINDLPGDVTRYEYVLKQTGGNTNDAQYKVAYYTTTASKEADSPISLAEVTDTSAFQRTFSVTLAIANVKLAAPTLHKTDESGDPLAGVTFALYKTGPDFDKNKEGSKKICDLTTDDNGSMTVSDEEDGTISKGYYLLEETYTPAPYVLESTPIQIVVNDDGVFVNAGTATDNVTVELGIGGLVNSMRGFAAADDVDATLHDVRAQPQTSRWDSENAKFEGWQGNGANSLHLCYTGAEEELGSLPYGPTSGVTDASTYTAAEGWTRLNITQCLEHNGNQANKQVLGDQSLNALFTGSTVIHVVNSKPQPPTTEQEEPPATEQPPVSTPAPTAAPVAATPAPAVVPATVATVPQTSDDMPLEALIVVTAAAAAAFVALLVVRKRRHGNDRSHP